MGWARKLRVEEKRAQGGAKTEPDAASADAADDDAAGGGAPALRSALRAVLAALPLPFAEAQACRCYLHPSFRWAPQRPPSAASDERLAAPLGAPWLPPAPPAPPAPRGKGAVAVTGGKSGDGAGGGSGRGGGVGKCASEATWLAEAPREAVAALDGECRLAAHDAGVCPALLLLLQVRHPRSTPFPSYHPLLALAPSLAPCLCWQLLPLKAAPPLPPHTRTAHPPSPAAAAAGVPSAAAARAAQARPSRARAPRLRALCRRQLPPEKTRAARTRRGVPHGRRPELRRGAPRGGGGGGARGRRGGGARALLAPRGGDRHRQAVGRRARRCGHLG